MESEQLTLQSLLDEAGIVMTAERADSNPYMAGSGEMDHWKVRLRAKKLGNTQLTTYFSMGYGHNGREPKVEDVLNCMASDAAGFESATGFEDWASEYGYDTDSRTAEKTYKAVTKQSAQLMRFLGQDLYERLLWTTERL